MPTICTLLNNVGDLFRFPWSIDLIPSGMIFPLLQSHIGKNICTFFCVYRTPYIVPIRKVVSWKNHTVKYTSNFLVLGCYECADTCTMIVLTFPPRYQVLRVQVLRYDARESERKFPMPADATDCSPKKIVNRQIWLAPLFVSLFSSSIRVPIPSDYHSPCLIKKVRRLVWMLFFPMTYGY